MRRDLAGLVKVAKRQREQQTKNRCGTCRLPAVRAAMAEALAAMQKHPDKYRGVNQVAVFDWCGAKAAGVRFDAWRKCGIAHHPGFLDIMAACR